MSFNLQELLNSDMANEQLVSTSEYYDTDKCNSLTKDFKQNHHNNLSIMSLNIQSLLSKTI